MPGASTFGASASRACIGPALLVLLGAADPAGGYAVVGDAIPASLTGRPGDPARIVASGELAARDLDWVMRHSLQEMVRSAWDARTAGPA